MNKEVYPTCQSSEINPLCYRLLDCYLATTTIPANFQCLKLKDLLYQTLTELYLSEIETIGWLILLEKIGLKNESVPPKTILLYTALKAKVHLGSAVHKEVLKLQSKYPSVIKDFRIWSSQIFVSDILNTPALGKRYRELSLPYECDTTNYNFYVDYILGVSPIYSSHLVCESRKPRKSNKVKNCENTDRNFIDEREFERIDG
ncbi:hypothetical protein SteCoe_3218 [Stentor coeruleus]|uniref:Uncharacterized protein n=1 Tax=Stentor coeruleus TaxID=5963 RepID=A0A1R2CXQ0_9CILI|nr:hypothetical protein SteCoe_3218 [Stentor coeruleus]